MKGAIHWEGQVGRTWTRDLWMAKGVKRERGTKIRDQNTVYAMFTNTQTHRGM